MEGEGKGNGGPTYKVREMKGGEGGERGLLRFPRGSRDARIVTDRSAGPKIE